MCIEDDVLGIEVILRWWELRAEEWVMAVGDLSVVLKERTLLVCAKKRVLGETRDVQITEGEWVKVQYERNGSRHTLCVAQENRCYSSSFEWTPSTSFPFQICDHATFDLLSCHSSLHSLTLHLPCSSFFPLNYSLLPSSLPSFPFTLHHASLITSHGMCITYSSLQSALQQPQQRSHTSCMEVIQSYFRRVQK